MTNGIKTPWTEVTKFAIATVSLVGFAWFIIYLLGIRNASDLEWTRGVYLLSGVEAVAFAAAGFLFGREVNRKRAENAEQRAEKAEGQASEETKKATAAETKGNALASAIRSKSALQGKKATALEGFSAESSRTATQADFEELVNLAGSLFPPK